MYENFYQLSADPFRLVPDPAFSFQHQSYRKAMTYMLHALRRAEGFVMITGQPGTGKTTLLSDLVHTLSHEQITIAKIISTQLTSNDLLNLVAYSFNLDPEGWSKAKLLVQVEHFLKQQYLHGRRPLLIVDEAQGMNAGALEELRLLTNMMVDNHQLLQVFLVGQEQLRDTVNTPELEQLQQRMIAATYLEPLDTDNTRAYIEHRLRCVNWRGDPLISKEAYAMIQRYSQGIPRRINQICSRLFLHGCTEEKHRLGTTELEMVAKELQQEFLLPMDIESIFDATPCSVEQNEETYEEEHQTGSVVTESSQASTQTPQGINIPVHPSSTRVADTSPHMSARQLDSDTAPDRDIRRSENTGLHAAWGAAVIVVVLITSILVGNLKEDAVDQPVSDQEILILGQRGIPPLQLAAIIDTEVTLPSYWSETPIPGEYADAGTGKNTGVALSDLQYDVPEPDPVETSLPPSMVAIVDLDKNPLPANAKSEETAVQSGPVQIEPVPTREVIPVLPQDNQTGEAENPLPADATSEETPVHSDPVQIEPAPSREVVLASPQDDQTGEAGNPMSVSVVVTTPPLTKAEKIAELLSKGQQSLKRDRLLTPENDSAYHNFQKVLRLDPGNSQAHYGMEQIVARYATLVTDALDKNDRKKAELYLARGLRIDQNNEDLLALRDRMYSPAPPVSIVTEQEPEGIFKRFRKFFSRQPAGKNEGRTDGP